jgi:hypothetical protein
MINHTYLRNKIADLQEQINRQRMINHRLMSLMETAAQYVDTNGNPIMVDETKLESDKNGNLTFNGVEVKKVDNKSTTNQPKPFNLDTNTFGPDKDPSSTPSAPSTPKPSDAKEPEKPSTPEVPQPNVDPSGLANQAGPGAAAMANQLAQAGVGAAGQPSQSGGVNLNFANMFAGQFAKGPVNVGGNQQVSSGSGAQTMNFGTMASGGAVVAGGGISGKVATGRGSIDSGNTSTTNTSNVNSGNTTTNTNSGNRTTTNTNTNSGNRTTTNTNTNINTNSGNTNTTTNTNSGNRTTNANKNKNVNVSGRGNKVTANENFELKVNETLNEMNRLFGRKDGGLRKS